MESARIRRWASRAALGFAVLVVVVVLAFAGRRGLWMVLLTVAAALVVLAAGFWFLLQRGVLRWLALALVVGVPVALLVLFAVNRLLWVALVGAALLLAAVTAARIALQPDPAEWRLPVRDVAPALRPFIVMNPKSGDGKVGRFDLQQRAEALGA